MKKKLILKLVLLVVVAFTVTASIAFAKDHPRLSDGTTAPSFTLQDINGKWIALSDIFSDNRITIINFWATWCPPCRQEIPEFETFHNVNKDNDVAVISICRESESKVKSFANKAGITYPIFLDDGKANKAYLITVVPTTYFVDNSGKVRDVVFSATNAQTLYERAIRILNN